jgi:hypothetical protein
LLGFLQRIWGLGEALYEYLFWREDWTRTWSPVSFWLAIGCGVILFIVVAAYGSEAWEYLQRLFGRTL